MWKPTKLEEIAQKKLIKDYGQVKGEELFAAYILVRKGLVEEILPDIKAVLPELTDHGPEHVANVLDNAHSLLEKTVSKFSGTDLYCLLLSIAFHDSGNIFDREDHQRKISQIYDYVRHHPEANRQEKHIVLKAVEAHCGEASDGSKDTLKDLDEISHLDGKRVNLRRLAAVLRFADELSEGPQRTSRFMQKLYGYPADSEIHHKYASITELCIDRGNERIALTYNVSVETDAACSLDTEKENNLRELLGYIFKRVTKLNQERQYAKHYCDFLSPFKKTTMALRFWIDSQPLDLELVKLTLTDLVVPGDIHKDLHEYDDSYAPDEIINRVRQVLATR